MSRALVNYSGVASLWLFGNWIIHAAQKWQLQRGEVERHEGDAETHGSVTGVTGPLCFSCP